jgi:hypothetical protein
MAVSVMIEYKDPAREALHHPFSFQSVMHGFWWPIAEKLQLPTLQRLEVLWITEREEAERFVAELRVVEEYLHRTGSDNEYVLTRIGEVVPIMEQAIAEWDQVAGVSI